MRRGDGGSVAQKRNADLTDRQREVLRLIAAGKTNAEIGEALGISLDGAKWHVSEILSKLDVATREEAAEWWRQHERPLAGVGRALRALLPGVGWKLVTAGVTVIAAIAGGAVLFSALHDSSPGGRSASAGSNEHPIVLVAYAGEPAASSQDLIVLDAT